jgi:phosphoenolpyruvate carboxylase
MIQQIDAPLREDVRLLGNLLGETLKQHAGQDLFNQVEQIRASPKVHVMVMQKPKKAGTTFLGLKDEEIH